eukprot:scaffold10998_cov56-Attheya_sp.AAC.1
MEFCKLIQAIEPTLTIKSAVNMTEWNNPTKFPLEGEYNVQERNPPRQARKILMHFTLKTKHHLNHLKHDPNVMSFLKANNTWVTHDNYRMYRPCETLHFVLFLLLRSAEIVFIANGYLERRHEVAEHKPPVHPVKQFCSSV